MLERLVDVLNDKNNVLHVFPVQLEANATCVTEDDFKQKALEAAVQAEIVPSSEEDTLQARMHVSRGGQLMPYGDALMTKHQQRVRERAYFLWQQAGCPDNQADMFWYHACEIQSATAD